MGEKIDPPVRSRETLQQLRFSCCQDPVFIEKAAVVTSAMVMFLQGNNPNSRDYLASNWLSDVEVPASLTEPLSLLREGSAESIIVASVLSNWRKRSAIPNVVAIIPYEGFNTPRAVIKLGEVQSIESNKTALDKMRIMGIPTNPVYVYSSKDAPRVALMLSPYLDGELPQVYDPHVQEWLLQVVPSTLKAWYESKLQRRLNGKTDHHGFTFVDLLPDNTIVVNGVPVCFDADYLPVGGKILSPDCVSGEIAHVIHMQLTTIGASFDLLGAQYDPISKKLVFPQKWLIG